MPQHIAPAIIIDGTLYTLLVFSLITWTIILFKVWQFAKSSYYNRQFEQAFWDSPDLDTAQSLPPEITRGPLARLANRGFEWLAEVQRSAGKTLKFRGLSQQQLLEQALRVQTQKEQRQMESGLTMLASIGSTSPFVGLFGTVLGIMHAMHEITSNGNASLNVVAGPIGDALIATAIGIAVAVPAVLAYNFFLRRAKLQRSTLENFADGFIHVIFGDDH
ncbi:MAG: flagellar motor protein MotA [Methylobacter sp.]|nr:MAG: flagellar motor protein MotA [Methylobacter sp.]PPD02689.1 MAG: flagellar motor protein MotA [Methylobacter sp.]PPD32304.1 MAG: flagellar motor protein MotA [Methylomonas sp.]